MKFLPVCLLGLLGLSGTARAGSSCESLIGSCDYYACVEEHALSCGDSGYLLGFGLPYCEKFGRLRPWPYLTPHESYLFPVQWTPWLDETRHCLQQSIDQYVAQAGSGVSCEDLSQVAFAAHPHCYTGKDSFCFLPPKDVARVGVVIGPEGFSRKEIREQVAQTAAICAEQTQMRIADEPNPLARLELGLYRNAWLLVAGNPRVLVNFEAMAGKN